MRISISTCVLAFIMCNSAFAGSRTTHNEEARCIAVFDVTSSLLEEDGTVPDKVSSIKEFSSRMSLRLALDSTVKQSKESSRIQAKEQDRLYARVNAATTDEATNAVYDSIFQDAESCKKLLPPE
jgi:hypothetical protein